MGYNNFKNILIFIVVLKIPLMYNVAREIRRRIKYMRKRIMIIICTIVILCVSSVVSAATSLKDIKNTKYEDSVDTLITLGLVSGYPEDNTYRPEKAVTRAEMAKLMVGDRG